MAAELLGTAELAALMGVQPKTVASYLARGVVVPSPTARLACGPIWRHADVKAWLATRRPVPTEASVTSRLDVLDAFVERHVEPVYRALRSSAPTPTRDGKDHRPRRVLSEADRRKTHAIGMGDYIEPPQHAPRVQDGRTIDRRRAVEMLAEVGGRSTDPRLRRVADAITEADKLRAIVERNLDPEVIFGDTPAPGWGTVAVAS